MAAEFMNVANLFKEVVEALESDWPASVDRDSVTATGEGARVQIVLIPHRQLGGFCLAIWAVSQGIEFIWAAVPDLSTHDDLDRAVRVASFDADPAWRENLRRQLAAEINKPITVSVTRRVFYRNLYCTIIHDAHPRRVFVGRAPAGYKGNETTSLAARDPLSINLLVPAANWQRWA
jgi:hypothetical protein